MTYLSVKVGELTRRDLILAAALAMSMPEIIRAEQAVQPVTLAELMEMDVDVNDGWTVPTDGSAPRPVLFKRSDRWFIDWGTE